MTVHSRNIKDAAAQLAGVFGSETAELIYCNVDDVNIEACTCSCTPITSKAVTGLENVLLKSEANDGFMLVPSVGSTVVVGISSLTKIPFVLLFEDIDQVLIKINNTTLNISDGLTQFNGGAKGGLINIIDLVKIVSDLQKDLNAIKQVFSATWAVVPNDGGAALKTAAATWAAQTFTLTVRADIEDTKITH